MKKAFFYDMDIGRIGIAENGRAVTNVFFGNTVAPDAYQQEETALLQQAAREIREYLEGARRVFCVPVEMEGTCFEKAVWQELCAIPYGQTRTYGELARGLGKPGASRAVGRANGRNPLSLLVPCHRVIGAGGKLTGYAGGVAVKEKLLSLERTAQ